MLSRSLLALTILASAHAAPPAPPAGPGQITAPIEWFALDDASSSSPTRQFASQKAPQSKLVLTASNGFFDHGIRASGEATVKDAADKRFIDPDFAYLHKWNVLGSTLRWHLWIETPGTLYAHSHFKIAPKAAGSKISFILGRDTRSLTTRPESDPTQAQGKALAFEIKKAGWHTLTLRLDELKGAEVGKLHKLELFGPAAVASRLLRTRWRPAACHARFSSSAVTKTDLWVMSSRSSPDAAVTSYSPITTPFGYFGTSFGADGIASGSANFSLWSYRRGKPIPQERWSHMLAVGSPLATFGSFGHEGSGVKMRGDWEPFGKDSKEITLALRREEAGKWNRWFGYYLDPASERFRLFAAGAEWHGDRPRKALNPGAFVEQPGPPDRRRGGDLVRDIHRRGWMLDDQKKWHPIDTMSTGRSTEVAAKHWRTTADGWFSMGMGGIPHFAGPGKPVRLANEGQTLPKFLQGKALEDLFRLPATIGPRQISKIGKTSATITIPLSDLGLKPGETAKLTLFHGPEDCFTFDHDLGYRETKTRFWPNHTPKKTVTEGDHTVTLDGLSSDTDHFYRILVESPRGRIWSFETDRFKTLP